MPHILITANAVALSRWVETFENAQIVAGIDAISPILSENTTAWVHLPSDADKATQLIEATVSHCPDARLVALADVPDDNQALQLMEIGIHGYCHAMASPQVLRQISSVVSNQGLWVGPKLLNRLIGALMADTKKPLEPPPELDSLSAREQEVAGLVGGGASNKEIARQLDITERTVKAHISSIFQKLELRDRLQLALMMRDYSTSK